MGIFALQYQAGVGWVSDSGQMDSWCFFFYVEVVVGFISEFRVGIGYCVVFIIKVGDNEK